MVLAKLYKSYTNEVQKNILTRKYLQYKNNAYGSTCEKNNVFFIEIKNITKEFFFSNMTTS